MTEPALIIETLEETPRERRLRFMSRQRYTGEKKELICTTFRFPRDAYNELSADLKEEGLTVKDLIWAALRSACNDRGIECPNNVIRRGAVARSPDKVLQEQNLCVDPETMLSKPCTNGTQYPTQEILPLEILPVSGRRASYKDWLDGILYNTEKENNTE